VKRLLLDTEALIWWDADSPALGGNARAAIQDSEEVYVSAASAWEIVIKHQLGKLRLPELPDRFMETRLEAYQATAMPIELQHVLQVAHLPLHHRDPFDRILVAQAQVERAVLVTTDRKLARYDVEILWADELPATDLHEAPAVYDVARTD
jgi:PIN domain nuclease of toxin-antitoxin system